jgi:hypothetical protein
VEHVGAALLEAEPLRDAQDPVDDEEEHEASPIVRFRIAYHVPSRSVAPEAAALYQGGRRDFDILSSLFDILRFAVVQIWHSLRRRC